VALTAFTARLGTSQGRVRAEGGAQDFVFVLGDQEQGRLAELAPGDYVEVTQSTDLTGVGFIRAQMRLRVPATVPSGFAWEAAIIVDGAKRAMVRGRPGGSREITDLGANVSKLSGPHTVGVRLELVAA
jgi:hypothetical protein